jgi:polyferredoxin
MELLKNEGNPMEKVSPFRQSLRTSLIAAGIAAFLLFFLIGGEGRTTQALVAGLLFAMVGGVFTFQILRTGRVNRTRLILFIGICLFFTIAFSLEHQINRGSILLTPTQFEENEVPICPLTVPFIVVPLIIRGVMIFPSSVKTLFGIGLLWLALALLFGRGWCSWICFFGGIDQACAAASKKPRLKVENLNRFWRIFPYAFLLFLILVAVGALYPLFCAWLCPLRIAYDPPAVNTTLEWLSAIIFVGGGLIFLVVGPLLTKKRLFCSLICPLLPANAILGQVSPFKVKVDRNKCTNCGRCEKVCESFAITKDSLAEGKVHLECTKCGRCMDICPKGAIDYCLIGTNLSVRPVLVTLAVVFNLLIMSSFIIALVRFLQTGTI